MKYFLAAVAVVLSATAVSATTVNGTGNVTPDVIFGSGNANGSFSSDNYFSTFEIALRAKLVHDLNGQPQNVFNYDGDRTYTFDPADSNAPAGRSAFNFEWSVNTDPQNVIGDALDDLDDLTYLLEIDYDPTVNTNFVSFDPINVPYADHAIGTNATVNGGGTVATDATEYANLIANKQVAQNSWNLGFFEPAGFDPQTEGQYTFNFSASFGGIKLGSASIDVIYGDVPAAAVPLPASLPLLAVALGGMGWAARRRKKAA